MIQQFKQWRRQRYYDDLLISKNWAYDMELAEGKLTLPKFVAWGRTQLPAEALSETRKHFKDDLWEPKQ